jgi:hypothetical protein
MAIDAYGREIVLFTPCTFEDKDLQNNRITQAGTYAVWIAYRRDPSTPPSAGYRVCDLDYQYTRWSESAQVIISNEAGVGLPPPPGVTATLSDDPVAFPWPILLGSIDVGLDASNRPVFDQISTTQGQRVYVGLRAQRVIAPAAGVSSDTPDASLPITVEADMRETKNLIVGQDFTIDTSHVKPPPADPSTFLGPEGNVRVANNLFLPGDLYKKVGADWLNLKEYVKTLMPEIQVNTKVITPPAPPTDPTTGTVSITLTSQVLKNPATAAVMVALAGIEWKSLNDQFAWWGEVAVGALNAPIVVKVGQENLQNIGPNQFTVDIRWTVLPQAQPSQLIQIQSLTVSYITVFYP